MTDQIRDLLHGKALCGNANGDKVLFTGVDFVMREIEKKPVYFLQLTGEAGAYLKATNNPDRGAEQLAEPLVVTIDQSVEKDAEIFCSSLSRALGLSEKEAIDGKNPDWLERFDEDHPKSVVAALKEKGIYVKATKKQNWEKAEKYGESPFYFNPHAISVREGVTSSKIAEIKAKLLAKAAPIDLDNLG
jgi:hypothetical protein